MINLLKYVCFCALIAAAGFFVGVCPSSGYAQDTHKFRCCHKKSVQDTAAPSDTTYWQLVHPKTAKLGAIFRKGDMYVLDTNEWIFFTISDTALVFVRSEVYEKYGTTLGKTQYAKLPSGKTLLSLLSELESEDDVEAISFRLKKGLVRDKTPKLRFLLYRYGNSYYEEGYIGLGSYESYLMELQVADNQVYVYYRNKSERELVNVPQNMSLEKYLDILEKSRNVDSIVLVDIGEDADEVDWIVQAGLSEIPMNTQGGLERIYMQDAWDITMGDSNRTVAVLELNGVDWSHYELGKGYDNYQNIYVNPGEDAWDTLHVSGKVTYSPAQLRRIIEKTAHKVGGYTYLQDNIHPNGAWNEEMGYGLVDAHAAVLNAVDSTLDLFVRDASDDSGSEPFSCSMPWNSPDIWIEDMDGNEVSHLVGNAYYYVCVRIHNRADHASTGYEKLYLNWVKAGPSTDWSAAWTGEKKLHLGNESIQLGSPIILPNNRSGHAIPIIAEGSSTVVRVRWKAPLPEEYLSFFAGEELRHFCLCARIHDGNPIAGEDADGINMGAFVRNSRKVAWKNISILEHPKLKMPMYVYSSRLQPICLKYVSTVSASGEWPHAVAEIRLKPDADMYAAWQLGGMLGSGFVRRADSSFLIQVANAEICGLLLDTSRLYTLTVEASFPSSTVLQNDTFHFDLVQCYRYTNAQGVLTDETVGGEHFRCIPPEGCDIDLEVSTMILSAFFRPKEVYTIVRF